MNAFPTIYSKGSLGAFLTCIILFFPLSPDATQKEYTSKTEHESLLPLSVTTEEHFCFM